VSELGRIAAAEAAARLAEPGMRLGLGTGRTMEAVLRALARRVREEGLAFAGIPTSEATAARARALGLLIAAPDTPCDLAIDGADQIERGTLRLLKGGGGALLREKIVAESAARFVVVADAAKLVDRLGTGFPLPVEVTPFGHEATARRIAALGGRPALRMAGGTPFRTDNGNLILDCPGFAPIRDPFTLDRVLRSLAGVVCTGLFLLPVECAFIGHEDGRVEELRA
jgi:ribose 5-phosphate isomerase A